MCSRCVPGVSCASPKSQSSSQKPYTPSSHWCRGFHGYWLTSLPWSIKARLFFFSCIYVFVCCENDDDVLYVCVYRSSSWNSHHLQPYLKQSSGFDFFFLVLFVCEWVPAQQIPETLKKAIQADKKQSMPMTKSLNGFFFQMLCSPICSLSCIWYTLFWTHMYICINCWLTAKE